MMNRIAVSCCAKWSKNCKVANRLFNTTACGYRKQSDSLLNLDFVSRYDRQAINRVLDVLNTRNENELMRYDITKGRLHNMERYRRKSGPFKNIEQLLEVDDFGTKVLEKLVVSIVEGPKEKDQHGGKRIQSLLRNLVTPILEDEKRTSINTVTSICVSAKHVSWAHMETNGRLLSWNSYEDFEWPKKDNTMQLHDLALKVRNKLPVSDIYISEEVDTQMHNPGKSQSYTIFMNLQRLQLTMMLISLIATNFDSSNEDGSYWTQIDNYYLLRRQVTGQLFRLVVGNESVSAIDLTNQIINNNVPEPFQHVLPVSIEYSGLEMYDKSDNFKKEALSQALLLSMAFIDLVLNCNPVSLHNLTFRKKDGVYG